MEDYRFTPKMSNIELWRRINLFNEKPNEKRTRPQATTIENPENMSKYLEMNYGQSTATALSQPQVHAERNNSDAGQSFTNAEKLSELIPKSRNTAPGNDGLTNEMLK